MKKIFLVFLISLALCGISYADGTNPYVIGGGVSAGGGGGTNWLTGGSCQAYYSFEGNDAARNDDSVSTNDLTEFTTGYHPTSDTTNYQEAAASAVFSPAGTDLGYSIAQTAMDADFPGNGSGDGEVTIGAWVRITTLASSDVLWNITSNLTGSGTFIMALAQWASDGSLTFNLNGSSEHTATANVSQDGWYFVATVFSDTDDEMMLYLRSEDGTTVDEANTTAESTETDLDDMTSSGGFTVGARYINSGGFYGNLDGLAVFNRAFTEAELDGVFTNGWDGDGW